MQLFLIAVGHKMPKWVEDGFAEYAKRMPPEARIILKEVKPEVRTNNSNAAQCMAREAERILATLPTNAYVIALDERGQDWSTETLAKHWGEWLGLGQPIAIIIGGADGLAPEVKTRAQLKLRLSSLTLPHGMVRVLLAEQLYRAHTIYHQHPYHRV